MDKRKRETEEEKEIKTERLRDVIRTEGDKETCIEG
jgi:hypothetical protein